MQLFYRVPELVDWSIVSDEMLPLYGGLGALHAAMAFELAGSR